MNSSMNFAADLFAAEHRHRLRQERLARLVAPGPRRPADPVGRLLRLEGLAAFLAASVFFAALGGAFWLYALLFLAPDLALAAYAFGPRIGARAYNMAHSYVGPAILGLAAAYAAPAALPVAAVWAAHVGFDRALGYGLKQETGFHDTHLGRIGGAA